ncbi:glycosyltransferase family 4 protein [Pedobacter sp. L105]|uniref:glycosyltransferase family 4 protein n=1 Tax=Pedobacter sp. L105 TaxID=1641871 RepID=UPI00131C4C85|nr:glycosyltransferase family 4 protein [Pedobacter sp. L105]
MEKIKIIEATNGLGIGGTEYVIQLYCKYLNKEHFDVKVVCLYAGGERVKLIQDMSIEVIVLNGDLNRLPQLLKETDVFHWHGPGRLNLELFTLVKTNKPKVVIQTNVFGDYEDSLLYDTIDYDLYVSKMILIRRMLKDKELKDHFSEKRKTLSNPVDLDHLCSLLPSEELIKKIREDNQLKDVFIVGRIGRADDAKFDVITLDGFAAFAAKVSNAKFLLVGATANMMEYAKKLNLLDKLIVLDNSLNLEALLIYYRLMDVYLAVSNLGESFGMVIAEAMTAGVPVVTVNTPDKDNAQIELVDNEKTGLVVAYDVKKIAAALFYLYKNEPIRTAMAIAAKEKVKNEYQASKIVNSLENLIYNQLQLISPHQEKSMIADYSPEMKRDYENRCLNLWEPEIN